MTEISEFVHEDELVRKNVSLWYTQIRWVKENEINLSSLLRILLCKEIKRRAKEEDS